MNPQASAPSIVLTNVEKRVGSARCLYSDLSIAFAPGEAVAIVGPSGCGKSTLLDMIAGVTPPDAGEVSIASQFGTSKPERQPRLGYIFQRDALLPWATVRENIALGLRCLGSAKRDASERAQAYIQRLGLGEIENLYPEQLSGGQRQLVALAQSLVIAPDILLLDEPFAHVDFQTKLKLEKELLDLFGAVRSADRERTTLVIVTHDIQEAIVIADRIIVLGGFPSGPTRILRDFRVEGIDNRDPVLSRESAPLRSYFREVWAAIQSVDSAITARQ
jgi:NitT/TauT family transport system ATP-binding protein